MSQRETTPQTLAEDKEFARWWARVAKREAKTMHVKFRLTPGEYAYLAKLAKADEEKSISAYVRDRIKEAENDALIKELITRLLDKLSNLETKLDGLEKAIKELKEGETHDSNN